MGGVEKNKFTRDIQLLEKALAYYCRNNNNLSPIEQKINSYTKHVSITNNEKLILRSQEHDVIRYTFYLAQSYKDINQHEKAILWYEIRILYGGWHEEIYYSMFQLGKSMMLSNKYSFKNILSFTKCT